MEQLLIEIGTEEIPSGYIEPALSAFRSRLLNRLEKERIEFGKASVFGTPRRLTVMVDNVAMRQASLTTELMGPPERVAFDEQGQPTVAARKFAEKSGVSVNKLALKETEKGRYLCVTKTERGEATSGILKQILPELILSIPFPKTMRWGEQRIAFARPIHTICALFGRQVISFRIGDVKSGRNTFGHRFMQPGKIGLEHPNQYVDALASAWVLADIDHRRSDMLEKMERAVAAVGGTILPDEELVGVVTHLVEYPEVVLGTIDRKFLELPREILVTAMREHQRYFAVVDKDDRMLPHFIAVNNTRAKDMAVVTAGNERVLKARLEDARFFYNTDRKIPLETFVEKLKAVLFQAELGSVYEKVERIRRIATFLAQQLNFDATETEHLDRAARFCKADLVSNAVIEFPKLQGIMGRVYAAAAGEPQPVAKAIEEHYRPTHSGGDLPETRMGAALSLADKLDTLCGCFYTGLIPTGASDPYALRRQAIGLILIAKKFDFDLSLTNAIGQGMSAFGDAKQADDSARAALHEFLKNRMARQLEEEGISKDLVAAVLSVSGDNILDVWRRAHVVYRMKEAPDFESLAAAFKRVVNIIRKADPEDTVSPIDSSLFEHASESALYDKFEAVKRSVDRHLHDGQVEEAFSEIAGMRPQVDAFFDDVMVMAKEDAIRKNRLALLKSISDLFARLADFSKIST